MGGSCALGSSLTAEPFQIPTAPVPCIFLCRSDHLVNGQPKTEMLRRCQLDAELSDGRKPNARMRVYTSCLHMSAHTHASSLVRMLAHMSAHVSTLRTCMRTCMPTCLHTPLHIWLHTCLHVYTHACAHACTHVCTQGTSCMHRRESALSGRRLPAY